jgi:excisionase family DNA binding protein
MPKKRLGQRYYTPPKAAKLLGVSRMTILRWVSDTNHPMYGKIKATRHPLTNRWRLSGIDVDRLTSKTLATMGLSAK